MPGINLAEQAHVIQILASESISGGKTCQAFSMKNAAHATIVIGFGVQGAEPPTAIVVNQCTAASGAGATALASFRYYYQLLGGAGNDVLNGAAQARANSNGNPPNFTSSVAGITQFPASVANLVYIIEIDSAELEAITNTVGTITEYPYLQVQITDSGNTTYASAWAVLSGFRYQNLLEASATV